MIFFVGLAKLLASYFWSFFFILFNHRLEEWMLSGEKLLESKDNYGCWHLFYSYCRWYLVQMAIFGILFPNTIPVDPCFIIKLIVNQTTETVLCRDSSTQHYFHMVTYGDRYSATVMKGIFSCGTPLQLFFHDWKLQPSFSLHKLLRPACHCEV